MSVSEPNRHELYEWFREQAGVERAETMMNLLPPTGWGDVATRRDLELLEMRLRTEIGELRGDMDTKFAEMRTEFADFRSDIADRLRVQTIAMTTVFLGGMSLAVALSVILTRLLG